MSILKVLSENNWRPRNPATEEEITRLKEAFQIDLPADYEEVLRTSNGCSLHGFKTPLIIWSIMEVLAHFREHDLYENIPHSLIFGGDSGGIIYCYDLRSKNSQGSYDVFLVYEDDSQYDKSFFRTSSLTDMVDRIVKNEEITREAN